VAVIAIVAATLLFLLAVACGLWLARERYRAFLLCLVLFMIGLLPMIMLNHVSELYLYNSMPFASALVGVGLGRCLELSRKNRAAHSAVIGLVLLLFTSHIIGVERKALLMRRNGERADILLSQIQPFLRKVPVDGRLILLNPPGDELEYSIFLMNGFDVLSNGLHRLNQLAGRHDFAVQIVDRSKADRAALDERCLVLSLGDGVTRVERADSNIER
jgi:hypothetical protein